MTPPTTRAPGATAYTPGSDAPPPSRWSHAHPAQVWTLLVIAGSVLTGLGFTLRWPGSELRAQGVDIHAEGVARAAADSMIRVSVDSLRHSRDDLYDRVTFVTYMQCVNTSPSKLSTKDQDKCTGIIKARLSP